MVNNEQLVKDYSSVNQQLEQAIEEFGKKLHKLYFEANIPIQSVLNDLYADIENNVNYYNDILSIDDFHAYLDLSNAYDQFIYAKLSNDSKFISIKISDSGGEHDYTMLTVPIVYFYDNNPEGFVNYEKKQFEEFLEHNREKLNNEDSDETNENKSENSLCVGHGLVETGLICPFCGKPIYAAICDNEGNIHSESGYETEKWSVSYAIYHATNDDENKCPIATYEGEIVGRHLYDSIEELTNDFAVLYLANNDLIFANIQLSAKLDEFGKYVYNRMFAESIPNPSHYCNPIENKLCSHFQYISNFYKYGSTSYNDEDDEISINYYRADPTLDEEECISISAKVFKNSTVDEFLDNWKKQVEEYIDKRAERLAEQEKIAKEKAAQEKEKQERALYEQLKAKFENN